MAVFVSRGLNGVLEGLCGNVMRVSWGFLALCTPILFIFGSL